VPLADPETLLVVCEPIRVMQLPRVQPPRKLLQSAAFRKERAVRCCAEQYVEAMLGIGQVHIEEARLAAGLLVPALEGVDSEQYKELNQEELEDLSRAQGRDANAKLKVALKKASSRILSVFSFPTRSCFSLSSMHAVSVI
jgi:hypothetical protein